MKKRCAILIVSAFVVTVGCNQSEPGGPGAKKADNKNVVTGSPKNETFRISAPATTTTLKQGEKKEIDVTVDRSSDFKQDVTLAFKGDSGVTVAPSSATVKASDKDTKVKVTVAAEKDAPIGEATIHVTARPQTGESTQADFKVNVKGT
jgi:uncharacterized membrane protein